MSFDFLGDLVRLSKAPAAPPTIRLEVDGKFETLITVFVLIVLFGSSSLSEAHSSSDSFLVSVTTVLYIVSSSSSSSRSSSTIMERP